MLTAVRLLSEPCQVCSNFDLGDSNQHQNMRTCKDCGKVFKEKVALKVVDPELCTHPNVNIARSSKTTHRITCAGCGITLYEKPQSSFKARGCEAPGFEDKDFKRSSSSTGGGIAPMPQLPDRCLTAPHAALVAQLFPSLVKTRSKKSDIIQEKEMHGLLEDAIDIILDADSSPVAMMAVKSN